MDNYARDFGVDFPRLGNRFKKRSEASPDYNCIAWAACECHRPWWPNPFAYWPPGLSLDCTLENFVEAFRGLGYELCGNGRNRERGFQKIAIYVDAYGEPTHAARQLWRGSWVSKIGTGNVDIEHASLDVLEGPLYGRVALIMKRQWTVPNLIKTFFLALKVSRPRI
jgi:hypothetical protein